MQESRYDIIPMISVSPSRISIYNRVIWNVPHSNNHAQKYIDTEQPVENQSFIHSSRKAEGKLSDHAKRKLTKSIEYLVATTTKRKQYEPTLQKTIVFQATFLTLTLPSAQQHDDKEIINKCLNPFLQEIIKFHVVRKYVWRAEKQKNGNIHFHILTDSFIPYYSIRDRWNRIVNRLGYVDRYQEKNGRKQPNSTDIHSVRKIANLAKYMIKYMTKDENTKNSKSTAPQSTTDQKNQPQQNEVQQTGRIWGCSHNLSNLKGYQQEIDSEVKEELKKIEKSGKARIYNGEYFTCININWKKLKSAGAEQLFKYFCNYLFETLGAPIQTELT